MSGTASRRRVLAFGMACVILLLTANIAYRTSARPSLPELKRCTRIEILFPVSALEYACPNYLIRPKILSPAELEFLESLDKIIVDEREQVTAIVHVLESATYSGPLEEMGRFRPRELSLRCYDDADSSMSFRVLTLSDKVVVVTSGGATFELRKPNLKWPLLLRDAWPVAARAGCAFRIRRLARGLEGISRVDSGRTPSRKWCDGVARWLLADQVLEDGEAPRDIAPIFQCPGAGPGECHYALNSNCEPNSPEDIVLLFETKAGWNQHGGPELFTFDNHDPKGGCVLLKDGSLKFVRTEEELRALRWK